MGFDQPFTDKIITQYRRGTPDDPFLDIKEMVSVINSQALLTEIPHRFNRVQVLEQITKGTGGNTTDIIDGGDFSIPYPQINSNVSQSIFYEIEYGAPASDQYSVDYSEGVITFNPSMEGAKFLVSYKGRGFHSLPASKIYTKTRDNQITQTLEDITSTLPDLNTSITNANTAATNANNATANFQTLLDQQLKIYKPAVANYATILTTYPAPQLGWTVTAIDTGVEWRYDGIEWKNIGYGDSADGFKIILSSTPPQNINTLWVNLPSGATSRNAKVVKSTTTPTDTSVIWWKLD